jgi:hypothetical protein
MHGFLSKGAMWACVAALLLGAHGAAAQTGGTAALQGQVVDESGGAVPGVLVTLVNAATGLTRTTTSGGTGNYQFLSLPPGIYEVRVELEGFRTVVYEKVPLEVDSTVRLDARLQIGSLTDTVQVVAETAAINTTDGSLGNVIRGTQIRELPLEGRNVVGLLSLQPGVVYVPPTGLTDARSGSVSGSRADQSNVTLDGIDVNDNQFQDAFTSVLRVTLDSVQEFRVTTSNYGADQGRSSGAQVSLVTRGGTNTYQGSAYWVHRNTATSTTPYFTKLSQLGAGQDPVPPKLNKHIFGGSFGGPLKRDRLFFFGNVEGLRELSESPVNRNVPSMSMRDGVLIYQCAVAALCPGGTVQGFNSSHSVPAGFYGLSPAETARIDPLGVGPSRAASTYWRQFPEPNDPGRDGRNIMGFRFNSPIENDFRTFISRLDYRVTGNQSLFGRLNFQDDATATAAQFPGQPPATTRTVKNRGFAVGHDWVLSQNSINTIRYGHTLIDNDVIGQRTGNWSEFRFLDNLVSTSSSNGREVGTHNFLNDFSWVRGAHTVKVGTNIRFTRNDRYTDASSWHNAVTNGSWVAGVGRRYMPCGACPAPADCSGLPAVAAGGQATYADGMIALLGVLSQANARYNYNIDGSVIPLGTPTTRLYGADEYEFYVQDSWRVGDKLTVSGGIRYSLFSPPYEVNGVQVAPEFSLGEWFNDREANMKAGIPSNASPRIRVVPSGPKNNGRGFYEWDKNNVAPRASFAWTPTPRDVFRGGYSLVYDRIGQGLATQFDTSGSFGLATSLASTFGQAYELNPAVRFTDVNTIPAVTLPSAPPAGFPATPRVGANQITNSLDDTIVTPYSHVFNIVYGRDIGRDFGIEAAYVGRRGRNQLVRRDLAMPLNLTDTRSGVDYFTAARQLIDAARNISPGAGASAYTAIGPIAYWENLFPGAAGGGLTATQAMAMSFNSYRPDYISALFDADLFCDPACSIFGPFSYFSEQYGSLAAMSTIGRSEYDSMQLTFRKRFSRGHQFDINYTYAWAKDHTSGVEQGFAFGNFGLGGYTDFIMNSWDPDLQYSNSDYDIRHQINVNGLAELPWGRGRALGGDMPAWLNAIVGDWAVAGIWRMTSGLPFNVINCRSCWATNWNLQGNAELVNPGQLPATGVVKGKVNGLPSTFQDPQNALTFFRNAYPGEVGFRNLLRGDGYFNIDLSLSKSWGLPFGHRLRFRWDTFNVTNTPRFDTGAVTMFPDITDTFGRYDNTFGTCDRAAGRCMQFNLRYEF